MVSEQVALAPAKAQEPPQATKADPDAGEAVNVKVVGRLPELKVRVCWHPDPAWPDAIWQLIWAPETSPVPVPAPCTERFTVTSKVSGSVGEPSLSFPPSQTATSREAVATASNLGDMKREGLKEVEILWTGL
jgi:hypothetical protein